MKNKRLFFCMGLLIDEKNIDLLNAVAQRERAPLYLVGETTDDQHLVFVDSKTGEKPIDLQLADMRLL